MVSVSHEMKGLLAERPLQGKKDVQLLSEPDEAALIVANQITDEVWDVGEKVFPQDLFGAD